MKKILYFISLSSCLSMSLQVFSQSKIDRSKAPESQKSPQISLTQPSVYHLKNGITLIISEDHRVRKVYARYWIDQGAITEGGKAGTLNMMGMMLNEGTAQHTKTDFNNILADLGANLNFRFSGATLSTLSSSFSASFKLMAEGIQQPSFNERAFNNLKDIESSGLKSQEKNVAVTASHLKRAIPFGLSHPAGEFETTETLENITLTNVTDTYYRYVTPSNGYLTITGDFKTNEALALAKKYFENWKGQPLLTGIPVNSINPAHSEIDLVDMPGSVQSEIHVESLYEVKKSDPDYFAAVLFNYILGGSAQSRLFANLREKNGFTYGAYSNMGAGRWQDIFDVYASVRNAKVDSAILEFTQEINRIRENDVTSEDLLAAKRLYLGNFIRGLEDPSQSSYLLSDILIYKLPTDFYSNYLKKINAVTIADIRRVAQRLLPPNQQRIIIVGDCTSYIKNLQNLAIPIYTYDRSGKRTGQIEAFTK